MKITLQYDDGRELVMTSGEFTLAFMEFLDHRRAPAQPPLIKEGCPHCKFGRTESGYCAYCKLGRDLKAVETRMTINPIGDLAGNEEESSS